MNFPEPQARVGGQSPGVKVEDEARQVPSLEGGVGVGVGVSADLWGLLPPLSATRGPGGAVALTPR